MNCLIIQHEVVSTKKIIISGSYIGGSGASTINRISSSDKSDDTIADMFLELWQKTDPNETTITYISEHKVRKILIEQAEHFPGLRIQKVITGAAPTEAWKICRKMLSDLVTDYENEHGIKKKRKTPTATPVVVATDASKGKLRKMAISAVSTTGIIRTSTVEAGQVVEGEFAAVLLALNHWGKTNEDLHILTDSLDVFERLNSKPSTRWKSDHEKKCLEKIQERRDTNKVVEIHWVRSHNGHFLNDLADRAALTVRRCKQWEMDETSKSFIDAFHEELRAGLVGKEPTDFIHEACNDFLPAMRKIPALAA